MKNSKKILAIDDDRNFLVSITALLESMKYKVVTAENPKEGLAKLVKEEPDLILLDIMMDSLFDGFSLCHVIKTDKEYSAYKNTPIIFVSAVKDKAGSRFQFESQSQGLVGPDDYLDKPVRPQELLEHIERQLNV